MPNASDSPTTTNERAIIAVPAAEAGSEISVASDAGAQLSFAFDPAAATAARNGNDLVFDIDGGGKVTIAGFFEVGDNALPDLTLPDGLVVSALDFFDGSGLDMTTAAGPDGGNATGGGSSYDDDAGALTQGVNALGTLGTFFWGRASGPGEIVDGRNAADSEEEAGAGAGTGGIAGTLSAHNAVEGDKITVTITIDQASESNIVFTLNTGDKVVVAAGNTSGSVEVDTRPDDLYKQGDENVKIEIVSVTDGSHHDYFAEHNNSVVVVVYDDQDPTTIKLGAENVTEGEQIIVSATVANAPESDLVLELNTGHRITIKAGETAGSVAVDSRPDDFYRQGDQKVEFSIDKIVADGGYEAIRTEGVSVIVADDEDPTSVSITTSDVVEADNGTVSFTIKLSNPPQGEALALVQVGDSVHKVAIGADGTGILTLEHGNDEDVYTDRSSVTATVIGVEGGGYELVTVDATATAHITDTVTPVTVSLEVLNGGTYYDGDSVNFRITLDNAAYEHAPTEDLYIELSTGQIVVVPKGESSCEFTLKTSDLGDGIKDGPLELAVADAYYDGQKDAAARTNYERLDHDNASAKVLVVAPHDFKDGLTVDETFIPGKGSQTDPATDSGASSHQQSGSFVTPVYQLDGMTVNGKPLVVGLKLNTDEGLFEITGVDRTSGEISYKYTLNEAYNHAGDTGPDQKADGVNKFEFKVNGLAIGTLNVNIEDDAPLISIDGASSSSFALGKQEGSMELKFTAEGLIERDYGADKAATLPDAAPDATEEYIVITHSSSIYNKASDSYANTGANKVSLTNADFDEQGRATVDIGGGRGILYLTKTEQGIEYTYLAKYGDADDKEHINIAVVDSDGDEASVDLNLSINYPVPAGTAMVDEAGLDGNDNGFDGGSHHPGYFGSESTVPLYLDEGTRAIDWDIDNMPALKADVGTGYKDVTWEQDGDRLYAKVDDIVVLEVSPNVTDSNMKVTLNYPVDHSDADSFRGLLLPYTPDSPTRIPNNVHITILDDHPMPLGDMEILAEPDTASYNIYLALDISGSMYQSISRGRYDATEDSKRTEEALDDTRMHAALDALKALVQSYSDAGADVRFTLLEFGSSGKIVRDGVTADQMLKYLNGKGYMSVTSGQTTNYTELGKLQSEIEADLSLSKYQGWENKVYFISDGAPDTGKTTPLSWQIAMDRLNVDVISVGIDVGSSEDAQIALKSVANSGDDVINVSLSSGDYTSLTDALLGTMEQKITGNLLANDVASADGMVLESITFGDTPYSFTRPDGSQVDSVNIDLGNGLSMTVEKDGSFTLTARTNIPDDYAVEGLKYSVRDNDGDSREANVVIILQDSAPLACDTVAQASHSILLDTFTSGEGWHSGGGDVVWNQDYASAEKAVDIPGAAGSLNPDQKGVFLTANGEDQASADAFRSLVTDAGLDSVAKVAEAAGLVGTITDGTAIAKEFNLADAGTISFNWMLEYGRESAAAYDKDDAAFWVLKDEAGNIIDVGKIAQAGTPLRFNAGVTEISVPEGGNYTVVLAVVDVTTTSERTKANLDARLFVDDMIFTSSGRPTHYEGNVITDSSPDGNVDQLFDKAFLSSVEVNGTVHSFTGAAQTVEIAIEGKGTLVMMGSGFYSFTPSEPGAAIDDLNILYTLKDQDGDTGSAWLYIRSDAHNIAGSSGDDNLTGTSGHDVISGGGGNDVIHGAAGDDVIYGGAGNDALYGDAGNDTLWGGEGDDTLVGGAGSDELRGGAGNDLIFGDGAPQGLEGLSDVQIQTGLADYLANPDNPSNTYSIAIREAAEGPGESDTLHGGSGDDVLFGQGGNDLIFGGSGNDFIHGGSGNDTIYGGAGNDTMMGGSGGDVFAWKVEDYDGGTDTILDFSLGQDKLSFENLFAGESASLEDCLSLLHNKVISVDIKNETDVTIQLDHQTVGVQFQGDGIGADIMDQYNSGEEDAAKAALMMQMLLNSGG